MQIRQLTSEGLLSALGICLPVPEVISLVGGGGKTSAMYELARELAGMGKRVIITTTTHIKRPEGYQVVITDRAEMLRSAVWEGNVLVTGREAPNGKLKGLPDEEIPRLSRFCDVLLIEADGAKCLPLKVPAAHEPVILKETQMVIACVGMDCIGRPLKEVCFRCELACAMLEKEPEDEVTPEDVAKILCSPEGGRKQVGSIPYRILLNKAEEGERREAAFRVAACLSEQTEGIAAVTAFRGSELTLALRIGPWKGRMV